MRGSCSTSCSSVLFQVDEYVVVVNDSVHGCGHDKSGKYVEDGMLLQEHGCQDNGNTENPGGSAQPFFPAQF